jgi:phage repressor protein C with HTH and peptisase S24 domain
MKHSEILEIITKKTGKTPTQQQLADILETTKNTIGSRAFRDKEYSIKEIVKISEATGVNLLHENSVNSKVFTREAREHLISDCRENEFIADYYPEVFGSCGTGTFVPAEHKEPMNVPIQCVNAYNANKKYSVIHAYGDSMQPYIHDKDLLVFEDYNGEQICDNRIYVFRYEDKIFIKRLVLNINQLIIKSDNAEYKPITVDLKDADIQIIGKFAGLMRKAD